MSRRYNACFLAPKTADRAYPLISAVYPAVSLEGWRTFVEHWMVERTATRLNPSDSRPKAVPGRTDPWQSRGVIGIENEQSYLCAVFCYSVAHDLHLGRVITADHVVTQDIVGQDSASRAVADVLESLAENLDCQGVAAALPDADCRTRNGELLDVLAGRGLRPQKVGLFKPLREGFAGD